MFCGVGFAAGLSIDHVTPQAWFIEGEAMGSIDAASNLVTACLNCNSLKRDMDLEVFALYLARRWPSRWTSERIAAMLSRVTAAAERPL